MWLQFPKPPMVFEIYRLIGSRNSKYKKTASGQFAHLIYSISVPSLLSRLINCYSPGHLVQHAQSGQFFSLFVMGIDTLSLNIGYKLNFLGLQQTQAHKTRRAFRAPDLDFC